MNYKTHNETGINVNGTSFQGYITCDFEYLVELFGEPICWVDDKTDWEWCIDLGNGHVATIYNWKNGPGYGIPAAPYDITRWHIGGRNGNAALAVQAIVKGGEWFEFVSDVSTHRPLFFAR